MKKIITTLAFIALVSFKLTAQNSFTEKDREMLIETKVKLEEMQKQMNIRFEQVDKRFEQVDKRLELQHQLILGILATFTALSIALIGLMLWDRKTAAKPFEQKFLTIEKKVNEIKEVSPRAIQKEKIKINQVITVLRKMAENDKQLAEILKSINLL
jgi:hypothetical protein